MSLLLYGAAVQGSGIFTPVCLVYQNIFSGESQEQFRLASDFKSETARRNKKLQVLNLKNGFSRASICESAGRDEHTSQGAASGSLILQVID